MHFPWKAHLVCILEYMREQSTVMESGDAA